MHDNPRLDHPKCTRGGIATPTRPNNQPTPSSGSSWRSKKTKIYSPSTPPPLGGASAANESDQCAIHKNYGGAGICASPSSSPPTGDRGFRLVFARTPHPLYDSLLYLLRGSSYRPSAPPPTAPQVRTLHSPRPPSGNGNPLRPTQFFALGGNLSSSTRLQFGFAFCSRDSPFRRASQTSGFLGVCVGRPTIPSPSAFPPRRLSPPLPG